MDFTCIFFGVLFTVVGFVFACGKGHIHLSAWKNMPQSEKDKIKIRLLCRNIGEVIALNGIIFLLKGFWSGFSDHRFVGANSGSGLLGTRGPEHGRASRLYGGGL